MAKPIVFVIGGPGSGKGTQCALIVEKYGFTHLSTGDLLREEVASGSEFGRRLNEIMKSGQLVSNEEVLGLLKLAIQKKSAESNGFLIDGYPREIEQAIRFESEVCSSSLVLLFECSDDEMVRRLVGRGRTSGRVDDNEETILMRLKTFHKNNQSILAHYEEKCLKLNAERDKNEIFGDVCQALNSLICVENIASSI